MSHGSAGVADAGSPTPDAGPTAPLPLALPPDASLLVVDESRDQSVLELLVLLELDFGGGGGGDGDGGGGGGIAISCGGCVCSCVAAGSGVGCCCGAAVVPVHGVMVRSRRKTTPGGAGAGLPLLVRTMMRRFMGRHGTRLGPTLPAFGAGCAAVAADQYSLEPTNH